MAGIAPGGLGISGGWPGVDAARLPNEGCLVPTQFDHALDAYVSQSIIARDTAHIWRSNAYHTMLHFYTPDLDDRINGGFDDWIEFGVQPKISLVSERAEKGIRVPITGNYQAAGSIVDVPNRLAGKYFSLNQNTRQYFMDSVYDKLGNVRSDIVRLTKFFHSRGDSSPKTVHYTGSSNVPGFYAQVSIANGKVALILGKNIDEKTEDLAKALGIRDQEGIRKVMHSHFHHEFHHLFEKDPGHHYRALIEMKLEENMAEFYEMMAKSTTGSISKAYSRLAAMSSNMAKHWEGETWKLETTFAKHKSLESRLESLVEEAKALGLSAEEAEEFIRENIEELAKQYTENEETTENKESSENKDIAESETVENNSQNIESEGSNE